MSGAASQWAETTRIAFGRGSAPAQAASCLGQRGSSISGGAPWPGYTGGRRLWAVELGEVWVVMVRFFLRGRCRGRGDCRDYSSTFNYFKALTVPAGDARRAPGVRTRAPPPPAA